MSNLKSIIEKINFNKVKNNMKCFICGKEYDPKDIQDFYLDDGEKPIKANKIKYQGIEFPMCNTCFRLTVFNLCLKEKYDIIK